MRIWDARILGFQFRRENPQALMFKVYILGYKLNLRYSSSYRLASFLLPLLRPHRLPLLLSSSIIAVTMADY